MGKRRKEGTGTGIQVCGYCALGPVSADGVDGGHARCYETDGKNFHCACAQAGHKLTLDVAAYMSSYCHISIERVYEAHGKKKRVLTDEQRTAKVAVLAKARAAKAAKRLPTNAVGAKDTVAL